MNLPIPNNPYMCFNYDFADKLSYIQWHDKVKRWTQSETGDMQYDKSKNYRAWCWTSFEDTIPQFDSSKHKYVCFQREVCPESKREHWQGYTEMLNPCKYRAVSKSLQLPDTTHVEPRKGSRDSAIEYCKKTESRKEGESLDNNL